MATNNAINLKSAGQVRYDGAGVFSGDTLTQYDVLVGGASNAIVSVGPGSAGQVLQSSGNAANPAYSTPTYPSASGTARKILVSDGTNNVYSTETWAVPGTSGNVLTSDGTNWTSATPSGTGNLLIATKTLTSSQIKNIHGTPIQIIAAPGSGKGIVIISATMKFNYGGSNVFVAAASQTINLYFNNTTRQAFFPLSSSTGIEIDFISNATIVSSANKFLIGQQAYTIVPQTAGALDNVNVAAYNSVATEISGNAAGDNTIDISVAYWIVTF